MSLRTDRHTADNPTVTDLSVTDFSYKPTLTGEKVVLRPFQAEDDPALRDALGDPEVLRLTGSVHEEPTPTDPEPVDPERDRKFRDWRNSQPDRLDLAVVDKVSGACVGEVVLNEYDAGNQSCNFRTLMAAAGRNRGLGTEALRMLVEYGFQRLGLHRIHLEVYAFNPRARHVYEKAGFVAEGVLRDALRYEDKWIDATVMSILAPEWQRHRGRP
jgi:RimJ/RimL family protein N-acetyltransferase